MRHYRRGRVWRVVKYGLLFLSGITVIFTAVSPLDDIQGVGDFVALAWAIGLAGTSFACFLGSLYGRWIGEYGFLPALWSVLAFYGLAAVKTSLDQPHEWPLLILGLATLGFSSGLVARWQDVRDLKKEADRHRSKG